MEGVIWHLYQRACQADLVMRVALQLTERLDGDT